MYKRVIVQYLLFFSLTLFGVPAAMADSPYDGWWFIANQPGTGLSLEIQGSTMFAAIFTYDQGSPVWYSSGAAWNASQKTASGALNYWTNNSVQENNRLEPSASDAGTFQITFTSDNDAIMTYSVKGKISNTTAHLKRFMPIASPGTPDKRVKGWWYDPTMNGIGIFLEAQGNTLFGAWYMYHSTEGGGLPFWISFTGSFPSDASNFTGPVTYWKEGSPIGVAPYKSPSSTNTSGHQLILNLKADGNMDVTWRANGKDAVFHMQRFRF